MITLASPHRPSNTFEALTLATIQNWKRLEGIVTNNVILPHTRFANLPNEQDILLLLPGHVVTLDMKELWPGKYRDSQGGWEHEGLDSWTRVEGFSHPMEIAFKKGKVVESFLASRTRQGGSQPKVLSCIVVPDACDVRDLTFRQDHRTSLGARLLLSRLAELEDTLLADLSAEDPQRRPSPSEIATIFGADRYVDVDSSACRLSDDLEITSYLETRDRPVPRRVYLGRQPSIPRRRLRVEVCPYDTLDREAASLMRAHRSNLLTLQEVQDPGVLRLYDHRLTPSAAVFVTEFFSSRTLADLLPANSDGLTWQILAPLFAGVCTTLHAAHKAGIIHRYLDPSCILVGGDPPSEIRVRDFFGAAVLDTSTLGQDPAANVYDAPERQPGATAGPWLDAFSVGRCIRFALTGNPLSWPNSPEGLASVLKRLEDPPIAREYAWKDLLRLLGVSAV